MESLFPGKNMFGAVLPYFDNAVSVDAKSFYYKTSPIVELSQQRRRVKFLLERELG
jgi:hypothetical protein